MGLRLTSKECADRRLIIRYMACAWMRLTSKECADRRLIIMRMARDGMCLTGRECDYNCLIIAGMDWAYLLVRRKILRLYRLTPL